MIRSIDWGCAAAALLGACALAACASGPRGGGDTLDAVAQAYVKLVLAIGRHDAMYVDAYYGPPAWKTEAEAGEPVPLDRLLADARDILAKTRAAQGDAERKRYLEKQLVAAEAHLRRLAGEKMTLEKECELLYDAVPPRHTVAEFEEAHRALEAIVPGKGPLVDRIESMRKAVYIPKDRVEATVRAALATARAANAPHRALPAEERFDVALVQGKPWGAYNWYKGGYVSLIELNTDLPVELNGLFGTMCHEGYPGHHVYNVLLERNLVKGHGWAEYQVYPLYSPQSLIAEGTANAGEDLLFDDDERRRVLSGVLAPVAGVSPEAVLAWDDVREAMRPLRYVRPEATRMLLDDGVPESEVVAFVMKWGLVTEERAKRSIAFANDYRSYVYNYTLGEDIVRKWIGDGPDRVDRFYDLISRPAVPSELN